MKKVAKSLVPSASNVFHAVENGGNGGKAYEAAFGTTRRLSGCQVLRGI